MILMRWDFRRHEYLPFGIPNSRKVGIWSENMNAPVDCANCGRRMTYGRGHTSLAIHTPLGIGYIVCSRCHAEEIKAALREEEEEEK